jgi:Na+/H+-dicarboxylate symporter
MSTTAAVKKRLVNLDLTGKIFLAMVLGAAFGLLYRALPESWYVFHGYIVDNVLNVVGGIFINLMKMIVVPLVFISLTCGICGLENVKKLGTMGLRTISLFVFTTMFAIFLAILFANIFHIGNGMHLPVLNYFRTEEVPNFKQFVINLFPDNPARAFADANILQIIVFSILLGLAINLSGEHGKRIATFFNDLNAIMMKLVMMIMCMAPYGVFCLIAVLFAKLGFSLILDLLGYFITVILVLIIHTFLTYGFLLRVYCKLSPRKFFNKMYSVLMFAFSVSSSNAALPLTLKTVEQKLGVKNSIASFVVPLGINMNKNGSAIMQGVAAIFIANAYGISIGIVGNVMIILTATLAAIGTAGAPSTGIIALILVLKQLGLPVEGIALIIGIDRLLDMMRTAVNVAGNAVVACMVGKAEHGIDEKIYNQNDC